MGLFRNMKSAPVEKRLSTELEAHLSAAEETPFGFAPYNPEGAEKAGYSNYSYWGSTFRVFFKNRLAVALLLVLLFLLLFTFIQPHLPKQHEANLIINHPITGMQLSNVPPSLTTVHANAPKGVQLIVTPYDDEAWAAVSNVLTELKARTAFTVIEYGAEFCKVQYKDWTGYVKNDFSTKLKLPDDPTSVPYESRSNFKIKLYSTPADYTNNGSELFVEKK